MSVTRTQRRRRITLLTALLVALALVLAGCGSSSSSSASSSGNASSSTSSTKFAKTKFVLHAGLAFGAFHRYIYTPLKAGDFNHPLEHKVTLVKAGLAGALVVHELKLALADAQADPTLSKLVSPLTDLQTKLSDLVSGIKSGHPDVSGLTSANGAISSINSLASSAGQTITQQIPSLL